MSKVMEQEWRLEIWSDGRYVPNPVLVTARDPLNYLEEGEAEPVASLSDLGAIIDYIREQFPEGWRVQAGKIVPFHSPREKSSSLPRPAETWQPKVTTTLPPMSSDDDTVPF